MTLDKEFEVAVEAVKLVISILRYHRDMLSDKVSPFSSRVLVDTMCSFHFLQSF